MNQKVFIPELKDKEEAERNTTFRENEIIEWNDLMRLYSNNAYFILHLQKNEEEKYVDDLEYKWINIKV